MAASGGSLRERLANKARRSVAHTFVLEDVAEEEAALRSARGLKFIAETKSDADAVKTHDAAIKRAEKALRAKTETVTLLAMRPDDFEALLDAHPATDGQKEKDSESIYDYDSLLPALLVESVQDSDMSEQDWATVLRENMSHGEWAEVRDKLLDLNGRAPDLDLPKG